MRVSKAEAAQSRERIVQVAAEQFREHGFDGIGVADLMKAAGLTHGGFYGHFDSKESLMAEAALRAFAPSSGGAEKAEKPTLERVLAAYLSPEHRDNPAQGCALAALGCDAARQSPAVRAAFSQGVEAAVAKLLPLFENLPVEQQREQALALCASMVGALMLSRAVGDAGLSGELLAACKSSLLNV
jgi:TetR/AcrR family transcriptional repressor of nem operon